ncbi:DUF2520 domain-containing protein [Corynebacterium antarcticum]|uniref:DUF2520 domain-containing protein n=1 Tax=Corynebacterium antarcticum TaxID=2800405 RepID=UPI0020061457|nr:DUF2520 domain-containing protein [Corynebacterium antarcticum]
MTPPRLRIGFYGTDGIAAGLAERLTGIGHRVVAAVDPRRTDIRFRFPAGGGVATEIGALRRCELVLICVADEDLPAAVGELIPHVGGAQMIAHLCASQGTRALGPLADEVALVMALHPCVYPVGSPDKAGVLRDADALESVPWLITADPGPPEGVAEVFVAELGGWPVPVPENERPAFAAGLQHATEHLMTVVDDACSMIDEAYFRSGGPQEGIGRALLRQTSRRVLEVALADPDHSVPGPVYRASVDTVRRQHDLGIPDSATARSYRDLARRTAELTPFGDIDIELWADRPSGGDHGREE